MVYLLAGVVLLEAILFIRKSFINSIRKKILVCGIVSTLFIIIMNYIENLFWTGIGFAISHILLLFLYLYYNYKMMLERVENKEVMRQTMIMLPTSFYIIPFTLLINIFCSKWINELLYANILLLFVCFIAGVHNFISNKKLQVLEDKADITKRELKQYLDRKNLLVELYELVVSLSASITYISVFNLVRAELIVTSIVAELLLLLFISHFYYRKFVKKIGLNAEGKGHQQKIIVPKTVGVGYTFNMDNPLSYVVLIVIIMIIVVFVKGVS